MTHAQQITGGGRGKCDWLLLFAYALPISPPLPRAYNVHGIIATPPGLPEAACSFNELGLFAFAYHRRMSRGIADGVPVPVPLVSPPPPLWSICCLSCLSWLVGDNNNSSELRAGWEMPLICSSCQLSRSEMKWKSHALMADDEAGPPSHSTLLTPSPHPATNGGCFLLFRCSAFHSV